MKIKGFLFFLFFTSIILFSSPLYPASNENKNMGFFFDTGFGWANNLRLEDSMNIYRDVIGKAVVPGGKAQNEKAAVIYGGLALQARFLSGNYVYEGIFGYLTTTKSHREVANAGLLWQADAQVKSLLIGASIYYKIEDSFESFHLLGGGLDFYSAKLTLKRSDLNNMQPYSGTGSTIGIHTGWEWDKALSSNLMLKLGIITRFAEVWKVKVYDGNNNQIYNSSLSFSGIYFSIGLGFML